MSINSGLHLKLCSHKLPDSTLTSLTLFFSEGCMSLQLLS